MTARAMFRWVDARGLVVAEVLQGARMTPGGPRAFYVARVAGEQVEKPRFACAKRIVEQWLKGNGIRATAVAP